MTVRQVILPIENRNDAVWRMDLGDEHAQDIAVCKYLDANVFPEPELIQLLVRAVHPGDFVVDCGACTGFFALLMAALGARVLAIEPGINNLPNLYHNVTLNNFVIDVRTVALGNNTETRSFLLIDDGGANSYTQPVDRPPGIISQVNVRRLPDLVMQSPKLIKLDIEGAEYETLQAWLKGPWTCPYIAVEYNTESMRRAGVSGEQLQFLMRGHGYEMFLLFADGMLPIMIPQDVRILTTKQNAMVLFSTPADVGRLWPEIVV